MSDETPKAKKKVVKGPGMNPRTRDVVAQDPKRQELKAGGAVFLDDVIRRDAEVRRAKVEGRDPNFDNPPAIVSTKLRPEKE